MFILNAYEFSEPLDNGTITVRIDSYCLLSAKRAFVSV